MSDYNIFKKINRNAFNEKLIHRYLFERYYFGNTQQRRKLLPARLQKSKINLIVPEASQGGGIYRADLVLYFRNREEGVPIEVKWLERGFNKKNQIDYLKERNGFVVILGDTDRQRIQGVDVVTIDHVDFSDWIAENITRLSRESLIYQAESQRLADRIQYWTVFIKGGDNGSGIKNFRRMLVNVDDVHTSPFWAFKQDPKALPHILNMQKNDRLVFLFTSSPGGGMAHSKSAQTKVIIYRYYICTIVEPYYMALDDTRGLFFEDKKEMPGIGDRRWPHFVDFEIESGHKKYELDIPLQFGKQGDFAEAFSNSFNHGGGTPYPLTRGQYEKLKDKLVKLSKELDEI